MRKKGSLTKEKHKQIVKNVRKEDETNRSYQKGDKSLNLKRQK
jgi:hypothetical protein